MVRVLVVDDEVAYRDALEIVLPHEGFETRAVGTGKEAIELAREFKPDILVIDWILRGGGDGVEVAAELLAALPQLRVILISGYPNSQLESRLKNMPRVQFLPKPFYLEKLFQALHDTDHQG